MVVYLKFLLYLCLVSRVCNDVHTRIAGLRRDTVEGN